MNRGPYEYTSPLSTYYSNNVLSEYDGAYQRATQETYAGKASSPIGYGTMDARTTRSDLYEGNNDTTLRAEERNWYIENHKSLEDQYVSNHVTLTRPHKEESVKAEDVPEVRGHAADKCGVKSGCCECWPSNPTNNSLLDKKTNSHSAIDIVASYGVYQNPNESDDNSGFVRTNEREYGYQNQEGRPQGIVIVNQSGDSAVLRTSDEVNDQGLFGKCCAWAIGNPGTSGDNQSEDCWVTCKPAIITFLLLFMLIVFGLVAGLLVYNNYMTYKPRQPVPEEPCEKTFCRWGAECVALPDGRAHCACPARCPTELAPVCSTAGRTHRNRCELRKEACERRLNTRVKHIGECEASELAGVDTATSRCPRSCPAQRRLVCGSDAREYPSACHLLKHACDQEVNITLKYEGKCDPCVSHACGPREVCQLDASRAPVCRCGASCALTAAPVCASDARTYATECEMRREACLSRQQLRIVYRGDCSTGVHPCAGVTCGAGERCTLDARGAPHCGCGPPCEPVLRPTCGSDAHTYDSECEMRRAACLSNRHVELAYDGVCGENDPCSHHTCAWGSSCQARGGRATCSCLSCERAPHAPVCASDANTYGSECKMRTHACNKQIHLDVLYNGTCESCEGHVCPHYGVCELDRARAKVNCVCRDNCTDVVPEFAVCGSDGTTYPSACHLQAAACHHQRPDLRQAFQGDCSLCAGVSCSWGARCSAGSCVCPTSCSGTSEPVCANNMQTFASECELQRAACPDGDHTHIEDHTPLSVIFYGDCKDRLAVAGAPVAITTTSMLPYHYSLSEITMENSTAIAITEEPGLPRSTMEQLACKDIRCDYDATCELGIDNYPRCNCLFDCPLDVSSEDYFPVCASDMNIYSSICAMRMEGCNKQAELRLRPLDLCKGMEVRPCGGRGAIVDPTTGLEIDCGSGPHRQDCPANSYCHQTVVAARCCAKNESKPIVKKGCENAEFGCCQDKVTAAQGLEFAGCPLQCSCNRLGSVSDSCDPNSLQCACRPGVGGLKCDRCEPGYWGLPKIHSGHTGCIPCGCSMFGSVREDCEQMTGRCVCKPGVQGQKCTVCTDHNEVLGPNGCYNIESGTSGAPTCAELVCYFGAVCVDSEGIATCQCPAANCPTDSTDASLVVCGSDSKTYSSECHLKLQACRSQEDVVVQAFGSCRSLVDPSGTALPDKPYSPLQFTQQDDVNWPSKSTRHLMVPDPRYYLYKNEISKKETPSGIDGISTALKSVHRPTPATVGVISALLGDLCSSDTDCLQLPGSRCSAGACICKPEYEPANDRKGCMAPLEMNNVPIEEYSACVSSPCYNRGTCVELPASSYACVCAAHHTGYNCEIALYDVDMAHFIDTPSFHGKSYLRLKPLKAYHKLNIDIEFRTFSENGVLVYNQQKVDGTGDFVSLAIVNGYVHFRYNLGDGVVTLTSPEKLSLVEYHKVSAKRYHRDAVLSVDSSEDVVGQSVGSLKALDLADDAYVGSVPTNYTKVWDNIGTSQGFTGCIRYLRLIRHQVTRRLGAGDSGVLAVHHVRSCRANPCVSMPCRNGATCQPLEDSAIEYTCTCPGGFKGVDCSERADPCESDPCGRQEGVVCDADSSTDQGYVCRCIFGGQLGIGNTCNNEITSSHVTATPQFNGSSYLQLGALDALGASFRLELWFLSHRQSGLLLYDAQSTKAKGDFIALNLVDGYVQFRYNLGSGIANITVPTRITAGRWHRVRATRIGRHGTLQLDHLPTRHDASPPPLTHLNLITPLYLGSLPVYMKPHRLSGVTSSFVGAIQQVFVNGNPLSLYADVTPECKIVPNEEVIPCATTGVTRYVGAPCDANDNPCLNGGTCIPILNEYKCVCREGYEGISCAVSLVPKVVSDDTVSFDGNNFYAYRNRGGRRKRGGGIRYQIKFRSTEQSGLLLWRRKSGPHDDHFIGLGLVEGRLQLSYSDGGSSNLDSSSAAAQQQHWFAVVQSDVLVSDGLWHVAVVRRRKRAVQLQVDGGATQRGYSRATMLPSKANPKIWIGGAPSLPHGLPLPFYHGFVGCIAALKLNGRHAQLHSPVGQRQHVQTCH